MLQYIKKIALIFLFFLTTLSALSQEKFTSRGSYAEKIYLQLDKTNYVVGSKIWFKFIVTDAVNHIPTTLSRVLHVELIYQDKTLIEKKLLKIQQGFGESFFELGKTLKEGRYLIRAYTEWNRNFDADFFFEEYIFISKLAPKSDSPIHNIRLTKSQSKQTRLEANFSPEKIDESHRGRLKVFINIGNKKDTIFLKKAKDDSYSIDYLIDNDSPLATLEFETKNNLKFSKNIILDEEKTDLQFFPESGEIVHGLDNRIGFKAIGVDGKGKFLEGKIYDEKDSLITSFKSNTLGMGSFMITDVNENKSYYAKIKNKLNNFSVYNLPKVASKGNIIGIDGQGSTIKITALSNYIQNDSISVKVDSRGHTYLTKKGMLQNGKYQFELPKNIVSEGILKFTMLDHLNRPVAERLYFNQRVDERININITTDEKSFSKREVTHLELKSTDTNGNPRETNMSLLVIKKDLLGKKQQLRENILSYFLMSSELRGAIESPGYYFNDSQDKSEDLDYLMLTQGWRKYNYTKPLGKISHQPEYNLSISGKVNRGAYANERGEKIDVSMITFGKNRAFFKEETDSLGNFAFNLPDEYGGFMPTTLQTSKKSGKNKNYKINFTKKNPPSISFNPTNLLEETDSLTQKFIYESTVKKKKEDIYLNSFGTEVLDEVVLKGYKLTPNRKKVIDRFGKPEAVITGKQLMESKEDWSNGIYHVIRYRYPNIVRIIERGNISVARIRGADRTFIVIDGTPIYHLLWRNVPYIRKEEVSSFEIIPCSKDIDKLWKEVIPWRRPPGINCIGVISIHTYGKRGFAGLKRTKGVTPATVPVFSEPQEFYSPEYEDRSAIDWTNPDLRDVVYWKPILKTDTNGKASATYYNTDEKGKFTIVVEAISKNGQLGYKELTYEVKD